MTNVIVCDLQKTLLLIVLLVFEKVGNRFIPYIVSIKSPFSYVPVLITHSCFLQFT